MILKVNHSEKDYWLWCLPTMNYGQFQRWDGHDVLEYQLELNLQVFKSKIETRFEKFRLEEIEDGETEGFEELDSFKQLGWPSLSTLIEHHKGLLAELLIFNDYEMLDALWENKEVKRRYSVNSLDQVQLSDNSIILKGKCFEV